MHKVKYDGPNQRLLKFLYVLNRDKLASGAIESIMQDNVDDLDSQSTNFSNAYQLAYCIDLMKRLGVYEPMMAADCLEPPAPPPKRPYVSMPSFDSMNADDVVEYYLEGITAMLNDDKAVDALRTVRRHHQKISLQAAWEALKKLPAWQQFDERRRMQAIDENSARVAADAARFSGQCP